MYPEKNIWVTYREELGIGLGLPSWLGLRESILCLYVHFTPLISRTHGLEFFVLMIEILMLHYY